MTYRYKTVKRGGKTVLLHRWLMEQSLGRSLALVRANITDVEREQVA